MKNYHNKYLKYKNKYLSVRDRQIGGALDTIKVISYNIIQDFVFKGIEDGIGSNLHGLNMEIPQEFKKQRIENIMVNLLQQKPDIILLQEVSYFENNNIEQIKDMWELDKYNNETRLKKYIRYGNYGNAIAIRGYKCDRKAHLNDNERNDHREDVDSATIIYDMDKYKLIDGKNGCLGIDKYANKKEDYILGEKPALYYVNKYKDFSGSSCSIALLQHTQSSFRIFVISVHHKILDWINADMEQYIIELIKFITPFLNDHKLTKNDNVIIGGDFNAGFFPKPKTSLGPNEQFKWSSYVKGLHEYFKTTYQIQIYESPTNITTSQNCRDGSIRQDDHIFFGTTNNEELPQKIIKFNNNTSNQLQQKLTKEAILLKVMCDNPSNQKIVTKILEDKDNIICYSKPLLDKLNYIPGRGIYGNNIMYDMYNIRNSLKNIDSTLGTLNQKWGIEKKNIEENNNIINNAILNHQNGQFTESISDHVPICIVFDINNPI